MPLSTTIMLPPDVQAQITSTAGMYGVDPFVASALATVLSGGVQMNPDGSPYVSNYGVGIMGIPAAIGTALGFDVTIESENISAGVLYLSLLVQQFVGKYQLAIAAYITSPNTVLTSNGIPPLPNVQNVVYNITMLASNAGSTLMSMTRTFQSQTTADPEPNTGTTQNYIGSQTVGQNGTAPGQASASANAALLSQSLNPSLQIDDGLSEKAWYNNKFLITGNPKVRQQVQPVTFMVYLDRNQKQTLHVPNTTQPIILQLNCSMKDFSLQSKHIYNRTPSRTGMHVTFWGMQADILQGTCTTGVFMNQFGLTDYMSTAQVPSSVQQQVRQVFYHNATTNPNAGRSALDSSLINIPEALRVAAQDAFMEFLKLFQMNGNIWFHTENYQGVMTEQEQQSFNAWSPKTGASSFQQHSRNNDVMSRGFVAMRYRNNIFLGYFKNLSWTQDASKPFSWDFNFSFQVEKTYTAVYWPSASGSTTVSGGFTENGAPPPTEVVA
jgi:hypothetical protein